MRLFEVSNWFKLANDRAECRQLCCTILEHEAATTPPSISCCVCKRVFRSQSGLARHKCATIRALPVCEQPGSVQCKECDRWLRSADGLAVHKCLPSTSPDENHDSRSSAAVSHATTSSRISISTLSCCEHHCNHCNRGFKLAQGFQRHNCHRGRRPVDRSGFQHVCSVCNRRFHFLRDMNRQKCIL